MNYILVTSTAVHSLQGGNLPGPTYIEYYDESDKVTALDAELQYKLQATRPEPTVNRTGPRLFYYKYTVNKPPLLVLEYLKLRGQHGQPGQHGYQVEKTGTIGNTWIWSLHKQTVTTDQSTPQTTEQNKP